MTMGYIRVIFLSTLFVFSLLAVDRLHAGNQLSTIIDAKEQPFLVGIEKREKEPRTTLSSQRRQVVYSLVLRNQTPKLNPGETVHVDIYLSGYGIPVRNKLHIQCSSDNVIDKKNPGYVQSFFEYRIYNNRKDRTQIIPIEPNKFPIFYGSTSHSGGTMDVLNHGIFMPTFHTPDTDNKDELEKVASELMVDDKPPLQYILNTSSDAPPGDYEIMFTFTYSDDQGLLQDRRTVQFHLNDWQESHPWAVPSALIIAFLSLLITAYGTIHTILIAKKSGS